MDNWHLLKIIGGKKAKKKTFGENPKNVASKVSSSWFPKSYPPIKRINNKDMWENRERERERERESERVSEWHNVNMWENRERERERWSEWVSDIMWICEKIERERERARGRERERERWAEKEGESGRQTDTRTEWDRVRDR